MDEQPVARPESSQSVKSSASSVAQSKPAPFVNRGQVPRVAVVGVHGVAYHAPGSTANAMADLLLSLPAEDHDTPRDFPSFRSVGIQVPLQRLAVYPPEPEKKKRTLFARMFDFLQEESADFARSTRGYASRTPDETRGFAGHEFMRQMLYRYEGGADGDAYVTARLEGKRDPHSKRGAAEVHIYEMLWADLARPTNGFVSFLLALFQLILHLGSLSRLAIDTGASQNSGRLWIAYRRVHRYAVRMLQIPLPLLKIILLIALYSCIPALLPATKDGTWFPIAVGAVAGLIVFFLLLRKTLKPVPSYRSLWVVQPVLAAIVGAAIGCVVRLDRARLAAPVAVIECWLTGTLLLWYVLSNYEDVRKGVTWIGWLLYGVSFFIFFVYLAGGAPVPKATLWVAEWIIAALRLSWQVLVFFAFLALILGALAWRSIPNQDARAKARAAVRTSRFALAVPCLMFLLVTSLLWANLFSLARKVQDPFLQTADASQKSNSQANNSQPNNEHKEEESMLPPGGKWLPEVLVPNPDEPPERARKDNCPPGPNCRGAQIQRQDAAMPPDCDPKNPNCKVVAVQFFDPAKQDYLEGVLAWSVTPGFVVTLGLAALAFLLLIWWVMPGVLSETFPLRTEDKPPRRSTNLLSMRMGSWNSRGLDSVSLGTFLVWCSIFVAPLYFIYPSKFQPMMKGITSWIVGYFIGASLAAAALAAIVKYSSPVLGAVLDVDTYLRTSPADATPRAKIVERYVSLLRYLVRYRDPGDGRGYDSVVIVGHSLGSVITADLLRFLYAEGDVALAPLGLAGQFEQTRGTISLKLLTMGNPIRQLLNRFFPFLYDWARENPDNGLRPLPAPVIAPPPTIVADALPDPAELGVSTWVNMYRSGDYVGRSLWLTEWYRRSSGSDSDGNYPQPIYVANSGRRSEMCIGAGAHTHYWDDTAPDAAEQLNALI